jgi:hypothetical protein
LRKIKALSLKKSSQKTANKNDLPFYVPKLMKLPQKVTKNIKI